MSNVAAVTRSRHRAYAEHVSPLGRGWGWDDGGEFPPTLSRRARPYLAALALLAAGLTLFAGMAHWWFFWLWPILMTVGAVEFHAAIIGVRVMVLYPDVFAALFSPAHVGALLVGVWFWWRARRRVEVARVS